MSKGKKFTHFVSVNAESYAEEILNKVSAPGKVKTAIVLALRYVCDYCNSKDSNAYLPEFTEVAKNIFLDLNLDEIIYLPKPLLQIDTKLLLCYDTEESERFSACLRRFIVHGILPAAADVQRDALLQIEREKDDNPPAVAYEFKIKEITTPLPYRNESTNDLRRADIFLQIREEAKSLGFSQTDNPKLYRSFFVREARFACFPIALFYNILEEQKLLNEFFTERKEKGDMLSQRYITRGFVEETLCLCAYRYFTHGANLQKDFLKLREEYDPTKEGVLFDCLDYLVNRLLDSSDFDALTGDKMRDFCDILANLCRVQDISKNGEKNSDEERRFFYKTRERLLRRSSVTKEFPAGYVPKTDATRKEPKENLLGVATKDGII